MNLYILLVIRLDLNDICLFSESLNLQFLLMLFQTELLKVLDFIT
jgi:hypothetical protein